MSIKYAYLGPAATFTEAALLKISEKNDQLIAYANVTAALNSVRNAECQKALVPIENLIKLIQMRSNQLPLTHTLKHNAEAILQKTFHMRS